MKTTLFYLLICCGLFSPFFLTNNNIHTSNDGYFLLTEKVQGNHEIIIYNQPLKFIYQEEYNDSDNKLSYEVYNSRRVISMSHTNIPLNTKYGENRFELNPTCCLNCGEMYILEVSNEKGEKRYLRFKLVPPNPGQPCPVKYNPGNIPKQGF